MWISDFAIRKPVITTVVMLSLAGLGLLALSQLETDEFPEIAPPVVVVSVPYPGANPAVVEREVIEPMEEAIQSISGLDELRSTAFDGYAQIIAQFDFERDPVEATQDVRDEISAIRDELPPEMEEPILTRFDPQDLPIVSLTLSSRSLDRAALTRLADPTIEAELAAIPGVAEVAIVGGLERELSVEIRPEALEAAGLSISEIAAVLGQENVEAPVGWITAGPIERTLRFQGRPQTPQEFADLVVSRANGRIVRLREVATVRDATEEPRAAAYFDGHPAVGIDIRKSLGFSTTTVAEAVRARVEALRPTLPEGTRLDIVRDSGVRVGRSVSDVQRTLLEGATLTILVVFVFLRSWRSTVITGLALPVSVLAAFVAVWLWGFTLNTMSLLGLSLSIGILIDDAIVVRENIVRKMEDGMDHLRAAHEGTSEIGPAVTATTLSIVVVFVPIGFMGGIAEQWFAPFALTIASAVLVSLFVSFSLDPMLSGHWPDPEAQGKPSWLARKLAIIDRAIDRITLGYRGVIRWSLRHRALTVLLAVASFVIALALPALGVVGSAFFPITDESEFQLQIETPPGSSLAFTESRVLAVARAAGAHPEVLYTYSTVGGTTGAVDEGSVFVKLTPKADRGTSQQEVMSQVRAEIARMTGVSAYAPTGFGTQRQIQLQLVGPELDTLNQVAEDIARRVDTIPGVVDVGLSSRGRRPQITVVPDREALGVIGVSAAEVAQALRTTFAGIDVGDWVDPTGQTRDVMLRAEPTGRDRPLDVAALPVRTPNGPTVPLAQVTRIEEGLAPARIEHLDGTRVVTVGANAQDRPLSAINQDIASALAEVSFPAGYTMVVGGETEDQADVFGRILTALAIAAVLMYLVLVMQFGSFVDPIAIMLSLPLSLIGVMLALLLTGSTLNLMSMIGMILLMGLVAKNAILLIDFAQKAIRAGHPRHESLVEAGAVRFRPIVMTSVAVIAGMLPVALGSGEGADFRAPLGIAVIGGVITSTILTLLVIPTFYDMLSSARDRLRGRARRRAGQQSERSEPAG